MVKKKQTARSERKAASKAGNVFSVKGHQRVKVEDLSSEDVVIGVMGPTGTGKSTFIEVATGVKGIVGHSLKSCTDDISVIRFSIPEILDANVCLVDTPGFDDTNRSDVDIFKKISDWLNDTYKKEIPLAGLLYFHRITDNRMAGSPLKNLRLFEKLCGKEFSKIVLTTTMWDDIDPSTGNQREGELRDIYWKSMINRGSSVKRFLSTPASAFDVLRPILTLAYQRPRLLLQKEMSDLKLKLKETTAGRALALQLEELVPRQQELLKAIRIDLLDPKLEQDQLQNLMQEYQGVSAKLQYVMKDIEAMKISLGEQFLNIVRVRNWRRMLWSKQQRPRTYDIPMGHHGGAEEVLNLESKEIADPDGEGSADNHNSHVRHGAYDENTLLDKEYQSGKLPHDKQESRTPDVNAQFQQSVPNSETIQVPRPSRTEERPAEHKVGIPGIVSAATANHSVDQKESKEIADPDSDGPADDQNDHVQDGDDEKPMPFDKENQSGKLPHDKQESRTPDVDARLQQSVQGSETTQVPRPPTTEERSAEHKVEMSGIANPKTTGNHPVDFGASDLLDHKQRAMATKPAETAGADGAHVKRLSSSIQPIPKDREVDSDLEGARRVEARVEPSSFSSFFKTRRRGPF